METISRLLLTFLLNACWQIALVAVVAALCARLLSTTAPRYRHRLWVAALVISLILPTLSCTQLLSNVIFKEQAQQQAAPLQSSPEFAQSAAKSTYTSSAAPERTSALVRINTAAAAVLSFLYIGFLFYRGIRFFRAWARTRAIRRSAYRIEPFEPVKHMIQKCQAAIGVSRVRVLYSDSLAVPVTVGNRNPLIILTSHLLREADSDAMMSVLGHELAHVSRRDYALNLLYELVYLPISFHPAAALIRRRIDHTRELCCDELVTERLIETKVYVRSLLQLFASALTLRQASTAMTIGITDADNMEERISSLLKRPRISVRKRNLSLAAASLCFALPCVGAVPFVLRVAVDQQNAGAGRQPAAAQNQEIEQQPMEQREQQEVLRKRQEGSHGAKRAAILNEDRELRPRHQSGISIDRANQAVAIQPETKLPERTLEHENQKVASGAGMDNNAPRESDQSSKNEPKHPDRTESSECETNSETE